MWFISIIVLNYNGKQFNKSCINSILKQSYNNFEIIFVDNYSSDGSLEEVKESYKEHIKSKKIIIVENKKNTWFAWGNNLWVKFANKKATYICLLNNDTTVPENRLEELIKGILSDEKLWAVGSIILDKWYEEMIKKQIFKEKKKFMLSIFGEATIEDIKTGELEKWIIETNWLSGCCFMYKKDIIKRPFEDYYFAYAEDIFLSRLLLINWYKLAYCSKSIVNHFGSWSFGKKPSNLKLLHGSKNQIINFLIFYSTWTKIKLFPLFLMTQLWHLALNAPIKRLWEKYKALIWIFNNLGEIKETRKMINNYRKINNNEFIAKLSHKFSDDIFYGKFSKTKIKMINIINIFFKIYCKFFFER